MVKIAVIEDSRAIASLYAAYLEGTEFEVHQFGSDASEITRLIEEGGFSIVLCPSYPKYQSGPVIVARIKAQPDLAGALFVVCTTLQKGELKSEWDFEDINGILVKPFKEEYLRQTLKDVYTSTAPPLREKPLALIVDDSNAVRKILSSALVSLDFDVVSAANGQEGLDIALEKRPDLILTDVEMPVMDGFEFCRRISGYPTIQNTPVVVISGSIDDYHFKRAFDAGAIDFLKKPVSQTSLAQVIESVAVRQYAVPSGTALISCQENTVCSIFIKILKSLNFHVNICATTAELETYLGVSIPHIIILDLSDSQEKLDLCRHVRDLTVESSPVIITVADEGERNTMVQCFQFGANEFITKPFSRDELKARIENHMRLKRLQDELLQKNKILESLAYKDKLTGLMNRRYFDEALKKALSRSQREHRPMTFMIMDLDNFKQVNDRYGHDVGDTVLQEIARVLMTTVEDQGICCRYGGEEFCIIFPDKDLDEATRMVEKIRRACAGRCISEHKIYQTISAGVAAYPRTSTMESIVIDADNLLYKAKQSGKNCVMSAV